MLHQTVKFIHLRKKSLSVFLLSKEKMLSYQEKQTWKRKTTSPCRVSIEEMPQERRENSKPKQRQKRWKLTILGIEKCVLRRYSDVKNCVTMYKLCCFGKWSLLLKHKWHLSLSPSYLIRDCRVLRDCFHFLFSFTNEPWQIHVGLDAERFISLEGGGEG